MSRTAEARGKPLAMLALVVVGWTAMRAAVWESPFPVQMREMLPQLPNLAEAREISERGELAIAAVSDGIREADASPGDPSATPSYVVRIPLEMKESAPRPPQFASARAASGGHQMLWLAAMSQLPIPSTLDHQAVTGTGPNAFQPGQDPKEKRWSVDAWALWRQGSGIAQGRRPSYGASQAGAVLNFRLRPSSGHDPRVYVRAYRALIDNPETEASLGVSARPVPSIPVRFHGEMRATERFGETEYRPSGFVTTELAPQQLPFEAVAEFYAQAGYVGGDFPTGFADGQLHVMREVKSLDPAKLSLGAGAWAGIQKGAERVDIGPSMRIDLDIGAVPARVAVDYREQVAGNAEPGSGVAVTVSTRF